MFMKDVPIAHNLFYERLILIFFLFKKIPSVEKKSWNIKQNDSKSVGSS